MQYRTLGKTGLKVSQLGFGCMRLPMIGTDKDARVDREKTREMFDRAIELGINYFDTAVGYCNSDSQVALGELLKGRRDKIVLSTKNPCYELDEKLWWKNLEDSLERLQCDYLDIYHHHAVNRKRWDSAGKQVRQWMQKAKDQSLVRHIACSFHDSPEMLDELIDSGYPEVLTVQYNMLNRQLEEQIARAAEAGIGVVVMGPLGGGRLGVRSEVLENMIPGIEAVPELGLRFVLANPNISVALSGMGELTHIEQNVAAASDTAAMSDQQKDAIEAHSARLKELANLYCTGCEYCLPCPQSVAIPRIFEMYNTGKVYGLWDAAKQSYAGIGKMPWDTGKNSTSCIDCGACEDKCPQNIPIRQQLSQCHESLS